MIKKREWFAIIAISSLILVGFMRLNEEMQQREKNRIAFLLEQRIQIIEISDFAYNRYDHNLIRVKGFQYFYQIIVKENIETVYLCYGNFYAIGDINIYKYLRN